MDTNTAREIPLDAIREAARHVYEAALRTPLVPLNMPVSNAAIYLKLENLQPIGSFKIRGAYNAVRKLSDAQRAQGVWTASAGNAGQGVALAAKKCGAHCTVLVTETAPVTKKDAIRRLGAAVVEASWDECWQAFQQRTYPGMEGCFIHPFDDDDVIAGNGTIALEILEDLPNVDCIVAPYGGGGLSCGIGSAIAALKPSVKVYGAEPATAAPLSRSFAAHQAENFPEFQASWVDGCGGKAIFPTMWPLAGRVLAGSIVPRLDEIRLALKLVAEKNRVICEGAGACAVAAALTGSLTGYVVCVVSGGNIDLSTFCELVSG
jgi:threonine dehydratase